MDKNARKDVGKMFSEIRADIILIVLSAIAGFIAKELTSYSPILIGILSFIIFIIIYYVAMEIKWAIKRKRGFVIVKGDAPHFANEEEKSIWIEIKSFNEFNKLKINVILRRLQYGVGISGTELTVGKDKKTFVRNKEIENIPEKIFLATAHDDKLRILIEDGTFDMIAVESYDEFHIQEKFEIIIEINGKINEEYIFSELYKGVMCYTFTKEPNIYIGENESYRQTEIKWIDLFRWSEKDEKNRNKQKKEYLDQEKLKKN